MSSTLSDFISQLRHHTTAAFCRHLLIIEGDFPWAQQICQQASSLYALPLWAGDDAPEGIPACSFQLAKNWLGQELDCLMINAHQSLDANVLGALSGTIKGGGVMFLLLPTGWKNTDTHSFFTQHLANLVEDYQVLSITQDRPLPDLSALAVAKTPRHYQPQHPRECLTEQQNQAVDAIIKVITGHRKRPLVLSADRGRGKSSALGIAAAELLLQRQLKIAVTAPSFATVSTLFAQAALRLPGSESSQTHRLSLGDSEMAFVAADRICAVARDFDAIFIDEAAAMNTDVLVRLLDKHNRLVFATTIHGYEGTGRGFEIKFKQALTTKMPQWQDFHLQQPIRWCENDPLERWIFDALFLNAEYRNVSTFAMSALTIKRISAAELLAEPALLSQVVGLLLHAHYQTSPNDVQQLLDDPSQHLLIATVDDTVLGCCLLVAEGGFDPELAQAVMLGKRRPQGHLLAQSITAHLGFPDAAIQRCFRILRIAVLPALQQQGIGSQLIQVAVRHAQRCNMDYIGTSFGATTELAQFWHKAGFSPLRLGVNKDKASGLHSLLSVKPINMTVASGWFNDARLLFSATFAAQRVEQFSQLDPTLFIQLYRQANVTCTYSPLSEQRAAYQLSAYANGALGYDLIIASLESCLSRFLSEHPEDMPKELLFVVAKVLQRQPWEAVIEQFNLVGKKKAEQSLRLFVATHLI